MAGMDASSKAFQNLPEEHLGHRSFALWSGTNGSVVGTFNDQNNSKCSSDRGLHMSTLAASSAAQGSSSATSSATARGGGMQDFFRTMSSSNTRAQTTIPDASPRSWAPPGVVGFPQQHTGGPLASEDLKIFNVLDRGRDSAVYQGAFFTSCLSMSLYLPSFHNLACWKTVEHCDRKLHGGRKGCFLAQQL